MQLSKKEGTHGYAVTGRTEARLVEEVEGEEYLDGSERGYRRSDHGAPVDFLTVSKDNSGYAYSMSSTTCIPRHIRRS